MKFQALNLGPVFRLPIDPGGIQNCEAREAGRSADGTSFKRWSSSRHFNSSTTGGELELSANLSGENYAFISSLTAQDLVSLRDDHLKV